MDGGEHIDECIAEGALAVAAICVREERRLGAAEPATLEASLRVTRGEPSASVIRNLHVARVAADRQGAVAIEVLDLVELDDPGASPRRCNTQSTVRRSRGGMASGSAMSVSSVYSAWTSFQRRPASAAAGR